MVNHRKFIEIKLNEMIDVIGGERERSGKKEYHIFVSYIDRI